MTGRIGRNGDRNAGCGKDCSNNPLIIIIIIQNVATDHDKVLTNKFKMKKKINFGKTREKINHGQWKSTGRNRPGLHLGANSTRLQVTYCRSKLPIDITAAARSNYSAFFSILMSSQPAVSAVCVCVCVHRVYYAITFDCSLKEGHTYI